MKNAFIAFLLFMLPGAVIISQIPSTFNYQAVARSLDGKVLRNQNLTIRISILRGHIDSVLIWQEEHSVTTNTLGLFNLEIGSESKMDGLIDEFKNINWGEDAHFLKIEIDDGGWVWLGTTQLLAVPYALNATSVSDLKSLDIKGDADLASDSSLFRVRRDDGKTVFAVYNDGVEVNIGENPQKKGAYHGFNVGSIELKAQDPPLYQPFFAISGELEMDLVNPSEPQFLWYPNKEAFLVGRVLVEHPDSVGTNSFASGFESKAVGNWSQALGYQTIARNDYSMAIGNGTLAQGENSFALGNQANAIGNDSYAFGSGAIAEGYRSFAFGSVGIDDEGNPTGSPTKASGQSSYAFGFGSVSEKFGGIAIGVRDTAAGPNSLAMGVETKTEGYGSVAIGERAYARGMRSYAFGNHARAYENYSTAIGKNPSANAPYTVAIGYEADANFFGSTAIGFEANASSAYSVALGQAKTEGEGSFAAGVNVNARGYRSVALGTRIMAQGNYSFGIGLSPGNYSIIEDAHAMAIMGGNVGIGTVSPKTKLDVIGSVNVDGKVYANATNFPEENELVTRKYVENVARRIIDVIVDNGLEGMIMYQDHSYRTKQIGDKVWMVENLKESVLNDGTLIPLIRDSLEWRNSTGPARCYQEDSQFLSYHFGYLYNFEVIETGKLCPDLWHVATDEDWKDLEVLAGMDPGDLNDIGERGAAENVALPLKANDQIWTMPGTDLFGFKAFPTGARNSNGGYIERDGNQAQFWTSTKISDQPYARSINVWGISRNPQFPKTGYAVRCVRVY